MDSVDGEVPDGEVDTGVYTYAILQGGDGEVTTGCVYVREYQNGLTG